MTALQFCPVGVLSAAVTVIVEDPRPVDETAPALLLATVPAAADARFFRYVHCLKVS